jgi:transcription elongation factor GreA
MAEEMTREQYDSLASDLAELEGPKRAQAVEAIKVARGYGDLSENFEYHSAKNEQGLLERRITMLRARLERATVVEGGGNAEVVSVGHTIVVENGSGERIEVELSPLGGAGTASPMSPLGAAVIGKKIGETVEIRAPRGAWQATILEIRN